MDKLLLMNFYLVITALLLNNFNPPTDLVSLAATVCALIKFTGLTLGLAGLVVIRAARRHPLPLG